MKFACPNPDCDNGVGFGDRKCSNCNLELSIGGLWKHYTERLRDGIRRRAVTQCPYDCCGAIIPISSKECPVCKKPLTVKAAFAPAQRRIQGLAQSRDPKILRRVQRVYFLLSGAVLLGLICYMENKSTDELMAEGFMSVLYLAVIFVLLRLFANPEKVRTILRHISPLVKFTLIINYLSLLLVLQVGIGTWWKKASILIGLFVATFLAIYISSQMVWTMTMEAKSWFAEVPEDSFNPSSPQGRKFRTEDGSA